MSLHCRPKARKGFLVWGRHRECFVQQVVKFPRLDGQHEHRRPVQAGDVVGFAVGVCGREHEHPQSLEPSDSHSLCAYKGRASYHSLAGADDIAWFYPDPLPDNAEIRDHVAFFNERADIEVDGELLERPRTQWS